MVRKCDGFLEVAADLLELRWISGSCGRMAVRCRGLFDVAVGGAKLPQRTRMVRRLLGVAVDCGDSAEIDRCRRRSRSFDVTLNDLRRLFRSCGVLDGSAGDYFAAS